MFAIFMLETELSYEGVKMHGSFLLVFTIFDHVFFFFASRPHITPPPPLGNDRPWGGAVNCRQHPGDDSDSW